MKNREAFGQHGTETHSTARHVGHIYWFALVARLRAFASQVLALAFLAFVLGACSAGPTSTPSPTRLRISGSTSMASALHQIAAVFQAQNPTVLVEIQSSDSMNGWDDLEAGRAHIAAISWWDQGTAVPDGYRLVPVARDAIAVVVHPRTPITNVTALQLRALFAGEILDWAALGGEPGEPVIVSREDGSGTRAAFESLIMGDRRATLNALVMPNTEAVVDYVSTHRLAVGYVSFDSADDRVRRIPVEGLLASKETASSRAYHLTRELYLAVREPLSPGLQAFLDYAQRPSGLAVWNEHYAPLERLLPLPTILK